MTNKEQNQAAAAKVNTKEQQQRNTPENAKSGQDKSAMLKTEIKKTWNKLTDDDIDLHEKQPDQFYARVNDKHGASREENEKSMEKIKATCDGQCSGNDKKTA